MKPHDELALVTRRAREVHDRAVAQSALLSRLEDNGDTDDELRVTRELLALLQSELAVLEHRRDIEEAAHAE